MNNSQGTSSKSGRKNIRKVLKDKQVADDTKQAAKEEEERLKRIMERQKLVCIFVCMYKGLSIIERFDNNTLYVINNI